MVRALFSPQNKTTDLKKANHPKGWDAKPLTYVPQPRNRVAGLPGGHSSSSELFVTQAPRRFDELFV
jgi:hypothetical protein